MSTTTARGATPDRLRVWRCAYRTPALLLHVLLALPTALLLINPLTARLRPGGERLDHRVIRLWSRGLVRIFGWRVRRSGTPLRGGVLLVANHVSWLDIEVIHCEVAAGFVAKAEIARWPLIGWLARRGGTIYHHRGRSDSLHGVMHTMLERLRRGLPVAVFPEGRTTSGESLGPFHARIFQPAVLAGVPAQPVALRYGEGGSAQTRVAFRPGETFLGNVLRLLGEPVQPVEVHFLEPVTAAGDGRRRLANLCRERILAALMGPA